MVEFFSLTLSLNPKMDFSGCCIFHQWSEICHSKKYKIIKSYFITCTCRILITSKTSIFQLKAYRITNRFVVIANAICNRYSRGFSNVTTGKKVMRLLLRASHLKTDELINFGIVSVILLLQQALCLSIQSISFCHRSWAKWENDTW